MRAKLGVDTFFGSAEILQNAAKAQGGGFTTSNIYYDMDSLGHMVMRQGPTLSKFVVHANTNVKFIIQCVDEA